MKTLRLALVVLGLLGVFVQSASAQQDQPLALILTADGPVMPAMREYIQRGLEFADQRGAEVVILQLNTPGGAITSMQEIIADIGSSPSRWWCMLRRAAPGLAPQGH